MFDSVINLNKYGQSFFKKEIIELFKKTNVFEPFEIEWLKEMLADDDNYSTFTDDYQWCIYYDSSKILGASCFGPIMKERPGRYDLYWIAVDPDYQGKGIGKKLLTKTEEKAKNQGASHMYIETGSWNKSGNALYKACGYKLMGILEEYYNETNHKHIWGKKL